MGRLINNESIHKDLIKDNAILVRSEYENRVVELIRLKYSQNEENAILRKKLANIDDGEFDIYNTYVESCKVQAKEE